MSLHGTLRSEGSPEKRTAERRTLRLGSSGRRAGGQTTDVVIHDLSMTGMLIENGDGLGLDETVTVELPQGGPRQAVVVWSSDRFDGCRFLEPLTPAMLSAALLKAAPASSESPPEAPAAPFADWLTARRKALGWSMEELAERLEVSRQSVWYWETGQRFPKPRTLARIAEKLGMDEGELQERETAARPVTDRMQSWKQQIATHFGVAASQVRIRIEF